MSGTPHAPGMRYEGRDLEAMDLAVNYRRWIIDEFRPFLGDVVAEIGAGSGAFTRDLAPFVRRRLYGIEPSGEQFPHLAQVAAAGPEFVPLQGVLSDHVERLAEGLDAVIYTNVLEHVEDDLGEVRRAAGLLRAGGHLCVFVPALPMLMSAFDRRIGHFRRYRRAGLAALAHGAGLSIVRLKFMDSAGALPWLIAMRLLRGDLSPGRVALYDRAVVPWLRVLERWVTPPIGKSLLLIARKA